MVNYEDLIPGMLLRAGSYYRGRSKERGDCFIEGNMYEVVKCSGRDELMLLCECSFNRDDGHGLFEEHSLLERMDMHGMSGPW